MCAIDDSDQHTPLDSLFSCPKSPRSRIPGAGMSADATLAVRQVDNIVRGHPKEPTQYFKRVVIETP